MTEETRQSPVYVLAYLLALVLYIVLIVYIPLPAEFGAGVRFLLGFLALGVAGALLQAALRLIQFAYKAIVELAAVFLFFLNLCVCGVAGALLVPLVEPLLRKLLAQRTLTSSDDLVIVAIVAVPLLLFVVDLLAFIVLHPLAQIAGTRLELED